MGGLADVIATCKWALKVPHTPHAELREHLVDIESKDSYEEAFVDVIVDVPQHLRRVVSGGRCLRYRSLKTERFLKQLFVDIAAHSPEGVQLEPYDLSHAHIVLTADDDVVLVFHAKEFPKEYRHSTVAPVLPIGDPAMGGKHDPRIGSPHSVNDATSHLRNYVYVLSKNTVYLADPKHKDYPAALLPNNEFHTLDEWRLGTVIGDVNYLREYGVLACPRHAISWTSKLKHVIGTVQTKASCVSDDQLAAMDSFSQRVVTQLRDDTRCLAASLDELKHLFKVATEGDLHDLNSIRLPGVSADLKHSLISYGREVLREKEEVKRKADERHKAELVDRGVCHYHAEEFLEITSSQHGYSAFRALQVLEVVHPQYRSPENTRAFGNRSYSVSVAVSACRKVYYADSALEALTLHEETGVSIDDACHAVVTKKEEQTRLSIKKQQQEQIAARAKQAP